MTFPKLRRKYPDIISVMEDAAAQLRDGEDPEQIMEWVDRWIGDTVAEQHREEVRKRITIYMTIVIDREGD